MDPITLETTMPGVFAGGDLVSGPATVIEAIVAGRKAARSISEYLKRRKPIVKEKTEDPTRH